MSQGWRARNTIGLWRSGEVRRIGRERRADRALVAVVAVGRADPRDCRVLARQLVGGDDQRRGQAVAHLVQARQHHAQPGVAALGMPDDQEVGAPGLGQLQAGERSPARRHAPPRGQHRGRRQHRPFLHAITDLQHDNHRDVDGTPLRTIRSLRYVQRSGPCRPVRRQIERSRLAAASPGNRLASSRGRDHRSADPTQYCHSPRLEFRRLLRSPDRDSCLPAAPEYRYLASTKRIRGIAGGRACAGDQGGWHEQ